VRHGVKERFDVTLRYEHARLAMAAVHPQDLLQREVNVESILLASAAPEREA
jgi:hypothetical protein